MKIKLLAALRLSLLIAICRLSGGILFAGNNASSLPGPTGSPLAANLPTSVTVAFWNIQWFPGHRPDATVGEEKRQIDAVHADIARLNADIIGMEEVRDSAHAGVAVQPLRGFKVDVCANFPPREGQDMAQEVALASRFQPLSAWAEEWKAAGAIVPPRGFAFAGYQLKPKQVLLIYTVHLKSNRDEDDDNIAVRQESIHQLLSHIAAMQNTYGRLGNITWIVGGDFNTSLEDRRFARETTLRSLIDQGFGWVWQKIPPASRITLPPEAGFPAACFDHIFYRGATLRRAAVVNTSPQSSDHRAIVATFDLP